MMYNSEEVKLYKLKCPLGDGWDEEAWMVISKDEYITNLFTSAEVSRQTALRNK